MRLKPVFGFKLRSIPDTPTVGIQPAKDVHDLDLRRVIPEGIREHLLAEHQIFTTYIGPPLPRECEGLRITPSVYTTLDELDRFCEAVEDVLQRGLPA